MARDPLGCIVVNDDIHQLRGAAREVRQMVQHGGQGLILLGFVVKGRMLDIGQRLAILLPSAFSLLPIRAQTWAVTSSRTLTVVTRLVGESDCHCP